MNGILFVLRALGWAILGAAIAASLMTYMAGGVR